MFSGYAVLPQVGQGDHLRLVIEPGTISAKVPSERDRILLRRQEGVNAHGT